MSGKNVKMLKRVALRERKRLADAVWNDAMHLAPGPRVKVAWSLALGGLRPLWGWVLAASVAAVLVLAGFLGGAVWAG